MLTCLQWASIKWKSLHNYEVQLLKTPVDPYTSDFFQVEHLNIHLKTYIPHYKSNFKGKMHCKFYVQVSFYCSMWILRNQHGLMFLVMAVFNKRGVLP